MSGEDTVSKIKNLQDDILTEFSDIEGQLIEKVVSLGHGSYKNKRIGIRFFSGNYAIIQSEQIGYDPGDDELVLQNEAFESDLVSMGFVTQEEFDQLQAMKNERQEKARRESEEANARKAYEQLKRRFEGQ